jgi:hypothetical protein
VGKTGKLGDFGRLNEWGELKEHGDTSMNSLGCLVEEERRQNGLTPVRSWGGTNGGGSALVKGRKERRRRAARALIPEEGQEGLEGPSTCGAQQWPVKRQQQWCGDVTPTWYASRGSTWWACPNVNNADF